MSDPTVVISSDPTSPIHPAGAPVTLTCTVELSPLVDVPVTVTTVWTGPYGFMTTQPVMGSNTTYTSTVMISSFGRGQSGNYSCAALISSVTLDSFITDSPTKNTTERITVGKLWFSWP